LSPLGVSSRSAYQYSDLVFQKFTLLYLVIDSSYTMKKSAFANFKPLL